MPRRQKPAEAPSVEELENDSAHVPRVYGDDERPLSDGPDHGEAVDEAPVPEEGAKSRLVHDRGVQ